MRKELDEDLLGSKLRQWKDRVEDWIQELKGYIGRNFSTKHDSYFNSRFEVISSVDREMLEEFYRMAKICRRLTGIEMH